MRILGVDPGCYGALALLDGGRLVEIEDMPILQIRRGKSDKAEVDGFNLAEIIRDWLPDMAVIERVGGITGQSAPAAFNFGRAAGAVEYTCKAMGIRVELISPATWKKALRLDKAGKDGARASAINRWPKFASSFTRKKDDGRAEAALIAGYGHIHLIGENNVFD